MSTVKPWIRDNDTCKIIEASAGWNATHRRWANAVAALTPSSAFTVTHPACRGGETFFSGVLK